MTCLSSLYDFVVVDAGSTLSSSTIVALTAADIVILVANPDLPLALQEGLNGPRQKACTYCNKCLLYVLEHPLGCYDQDRYEEGPKTPECHRRMIADVFEIFTDYTEPGRPGGAP